MKQKESVGKKLKIRGEERRGNMRRGGDKRKERDGKKRRRRGEETTGEARD